MLSHKISGLPVTDAGKLVGMITTTDILQAFLDMLGASEEGSFRIDLLLQEGHDLALAANTIAEEGGEVTGVGIHRESWDASRVCYLHARSADPDRLADALKAKGYTVLGVHV
jgi:acetoin utilization protein AcuB